MTTIRRPTAHSVTVLGGSPTPARLEALPPAVPAPCTDCPWRRRARRGWLGPYTAREWLGIIHSDEPIACHMTIRESGSWIGAKQCAGAARFRANVHKSPRDPAVARGPRDERGIFATNAEFLSHHADTSLGQYLAEQRAKEAPR